MPTKSDLPTVADVDHAWRTPLTTILGLSEILQTEMFGPLKNRRYQGYVDDIHASAAELCDLIRNGGRNGGDPFAPTAGAWAGRLGPKRGAGSLPGGAKGADRNRSRTAPVGRQERTLIGLMGRAYGAAVEPHLWQSFLADFRDIFRGTACVLSFHDFQSDTCRVWYSVGKAADCVMSCLSCITPDPAINGNSNNGGTLPPIGTVWTDEDFVPERAPGGNDRARTWRQCRKSHRCMGSVLLREGAEFFVISVLKSRRAGGFDPGEIALFEQFVPHLQDAVRIHRMVSQAQTSFEAAVDALNRLPLAVILIDGCGKAFSYNRYARDLIAAGEGLRLGRDDLCAETAEETARLRKLIAEAVSTTDAPSSKAGKALSLSRPGGRRPLSALVLPLRMTSGFLGRIEPVAALFVADPEERGEPGEKRLRRLYQLTRKEARVAALIAQGESVDTIAKTLRITPNTVRSHLKHVFSKTDTERQAELVHLVLTSPAILRRD